MKTFLHTGRTGRTIDLEYRKDTEVKRVVAELRPGETAVVPEDHPFVLDLIVRGELQAVADEAEPESAPKPKLKKAGGGE